jgi:hypothetical protein
MPAPRASKLSILTFPQHWKDGTLRVRFLCLPKGDPEQLLGGQSSFATANLVFTARVISGLDQLPRAADAAQIGPLTLVKPPLGKAALLSELTQHFQIVSRPKAVGAAQPSFRKPLAESYRALVGDRQMSTSIVSPDEFECALHDAHTSQPPGPVELDSGVTWARLVAFLLKQPVLAEACGFMGETTVTLPDPTLFAEGGWLYLDLHDTSDYFGAPGGFTSLYAARIPSLDGERPLFAAVLFPVDGAAPVDDVYREAERYGFGFMRLVHGAQTEDHGDAIRLAWDDEQVTDWMTRQVNPAADAPMGTAGFRVDVRLHKDGNATWNSLQKIRSVDRLALGPIDFGTFTGDAVVEVNPVQVSPDKPGEYWMPPYFATWRGSSLALIDQDLVDLHQHPELDNPDLPPHRLGRDEHFVPFDDKLVPLRYGETYEFRVRMADLTRGGPAADADVTLAPDSIATIDFRRRTRPGQINILARPTKDAHSLQIAKPRLGYPDALFTGKIVFADLSDDFLAKPEREFSVPDPDVLRVTVLVEVRALVGDEVSWLQLYTTHRLFAEDALTLDLDLQDHATLDTFSGNQPDDGPLSIPTARDLRFTLTAMGRDDAGYFDSDAARTGLPITVELRAEAIAEEPMFSLPDPPVLGLFFQSPPADGTVAAPVQRLAQEVELNASGLTVSGRPGHRTIFGSSAALQHTLATEGSSITFASNADLIGRWVNVVRFTIARDWTWDGLVDAGFEVRRIVRRAKKDDLDQLAGNVRLSRSLSFAARADVAPDPRAPQRQFTDVVFFDAFDPKPEPGSFPGEITFEYRIATAFKGDAAVPDPELLPALLVPVTTPPAQVPRLVSAGIALSKFVPAIDYSSTHERTRSLWIEFEEKPLDEEDSYFIRILADAPDPMLTNEAIAEVTETSLAIDPEWLRLITPGQPRDRNGLTAMNEPAPNSPDNRHWIVPLPEGLNASSPELFGMYTYEVRLGHTDSRWSTAQGRFGPPLRVAGVQHPSPPLVCQAARTDQAIRVRAAFATPVYKGLNVRPLFPKTAIWGVLYARVQQMDGVSWRNLVLTRAELQPPLALLANAAPESNAALLYGEGEFEIDSVHDLLRLLGLPEDAPLTTLAVEFFRGDSSPDPAPNPLEFDLGFAQILRISPLAPVPDAC